MIKLFEKTEKLIEKISPQWALKRKINRQRLDLVDQFKTKERSFETEENSRLFYDFLKPTSDADSNIGTSHKNLRYTIRQLEDNNGNVKGPITRDADNVVGTGFAFQSTVTADKKYIRNSPNRITSNLAEEFIFYAEKYFKQWAKQADIRLLLHFWEIQRLIRMALLRDGEILVIGRESTRPDRLIPYCQEVVEIDRLDTPSRFMNDDRVKNGIRFNAEGAPSVYYVLKQHPGNTQVIANIDDYEAIPAFYPNGARRVMHIANLRRAEQTRGLSDFVSGLPMIENATRYSKAELFASLQDACMVATVKTNAPAGFQANYTTTGDDSDKRINEISPGMVHYLNQWEEINIREPSRPNDHYDEIVNSFYRDPANGINMPLEVYMQNWQGMNYSNARTVDIQYGKPLSVAQKKMLDHYCNNTWECVCNALVASGLLYAPGFASGRKEDYLNCSWIPPKREWIDPVKEAQGKMLEIQMGVENPQNICNSKGRDFKENAEIMAKNLATNKELEEEYDVKMPSLIGGGQNTNDKEEDDDTSTGNDTNNNKVIKMKKK